MFNRLRSLNVKHPSFFKAKLFEEYFQYLQGNLVIRSNNVELQDLTGNFSTKLHLP